MGRTGQRCAALMLLALAWPLAAGSEGVVIGAEAAARWRAVGSLTVAGHRVCSAALISDHEAITAAHCVVNRQTGLRTPAAALHLVLGQTAAGQAAVRGVVASAVLPDYLASRAEGGLGNLVYDTALLVLDAPVSAGEAMPLEVVDWPKPVGDFVDILGYEKAGPDAVTLREGCTALDSLDGVTTVNCAVVAGLSGAPVLLNAYPDAPPILVATVSSRSMGAATSLTFVVTVAPRLAALRALILNETPQ